jgi:site-specific DNA-methyltransferase (cytosine-N4-specific)
MMVPELQGALLDDVLEVQTDAKLVYDPFAGSGTVMLESLYRGLDFHGSDINPLAVLLCQVKATPPSQADALAAVTIVLELAKTESEIEIPEFPGIDKWFKPEIKNGLARLRDAIKKQTDLDTRRFLWICLAETIRLVSNSRISTFKLHTYTAEDITKRVADAIKVFENVATLNAARVAKHWTRIEHAPRHGGAAQALLLPGAVSNPWTAPRQADILMTSPPYGDNKTTVPYGQHSYLPLRWLDPDDIPGGFDPGLLDSTSRIDTMSLGGSLKEADVSRAGLERDSPALAEFLLKIQDIPALRKKVLSFCRDYQDSLTLVSARLKPGAFCFFTLGERRVGKQVFPLVEITKQLLEAEGHEVVTVIERVLPAGRKRMASKNSEGATMATEWILVTEAQKNADDS